jgi:predicted 3-demethylubiquinone-9 3-methyltransferase (glyoxalase superfamily)
MSIAPTICPCLWFDGRAQEAADFYVSVFPNSRLTAVARYGEAGRELHGKTPGSVMTVSFELDGQPFMALNGGPHFKFTEAVSFQVLCDTQEQIDYYWAALGEGGDPHAQECGWLKDRYGLSWQVLPRVLPQWLAEAESLPAQRTMAALLRMKKLEIAALRAAYEERG